MKKSFWINLGLILFSVFITLLLAEFVFRKILLNNSENFKSWKKPSLYSNYIEHPDGDLFDDDYWKLNYIFNRQFNIEEPDPLLCWTGAFKKESHIHFHEEQLNGRRPVLLYGDSFAQCVEWVDCFEDILNSDSAFSAGHYLLNFGTGGYGVDQIYLLFTETIDRFDRPFVIFSLLTTDMDRCMVKFRDAQKPYFVFKDSTLLLQGTPITLSTSEYIEQNPPEITSYLWRRLKNSDLNFLRDDEKRAAEKIAKIKTLNIQLLRETFRKLKSLNTDYLVLVFHPEHHHPDDWRLTFLRDFLAEEKVPHLFDVDIRNSDTTFSTYDGRNYAIEGNGHPTFHLNKLISNEIKRKVLSSK